jgi:hypothetical protein
MTNDNRLVLRGTLSFLVQYIYSVALLTHQHGYSDSLNKLAANSITSFFLKISCHLTRAQSLPHPGLSGSALLIRV